MTAGIPKDILALNQILFQEYTIHNGFKHQGWQSIRMKTFTQSLNNTSLMLSEASRMMKECTYGISTMNQVTLVMKEKHFLF
jgi:hypothetical protein